MPSCPDSFPASPSTASSGRPHGCPERARAGREAGRGPGGGTGSGWSACRRARRRGGFAQFAPAAVRRSWRRACAIEAQLQDSPSDRGLAEHQARDHSFRPIFIPDSRPSAPSVSVSPCGNPGSCGSRGPCFLASGVFASDIPPLSALQCRPVPPPPSGSLEMAVACRSGMHLQRIVGRRKGEYRFLSPSISISYDICGLNPCRNVGRAGAARPRGRGGPPLPNA